MGLLSRIQRDCGISRDDFLGSSKSILHLTLSPIQTEKRLTKWRWEITFSSLEDSDSRHLLVFSAKGALSEISERRWESVRSSCRCSTILRGLSGTMLCRFFIRTSSLPSSYPNHSSSRGTNVFLSLRHLYCLSMNSSYLTNDISCVTLILCVKHWAYRLYSSVSWYGWHGWLVLQTGDESFSNSMVLRTVCPCSLCRVFGWRMWLGRGPTAHHRVFRRGG